MVTQLSVEASKLPPANLFPHQHSRLYCRPAYLAPAALTAAMRLSTVMSAASNSRAKSAPRPPAPHSSRAPGRHRRWATICGAPGPAWPLHLLQQQAVAGPALLKPISRAGHAAVGDTCRALAKICRIKSYVSLGAGNVEDYCMRFDGSYASAHNTWIPPPSHHNQRLRKDAYQ